MLTKLRENIEIAVSIILLLLLITCLDPLESFMPAFWEQMLTVLLIVLFGVFAGLFFKERGRDEREKSHLVLADRTAFLAGVGLLIFFIILDILSVHSDKALIFVLSGMLLTKLITLVVLKSIR